MVSLRKIAAAGIVAAAMLSGSAVPAATQVPGGDEECDYNLVIDDWFIVGTTPIFSWHLEVTCVKIIDDEGQ